MHKCLCFNSRHINKNHKLIKIHSNSDMSESRENKTKFRDFSDNDINNPPTIKMYIVLNVQR